MITKEDMEAMGIFTYEYSIPDEGLEDFFRECFSQRDEDMKEISAYTEFDAYQDWTDETAIYPMDKGLEYVALGLASESGELAGKIKKWIRDGVIDHDEVAKELGDVLWYVARMATELNMFLSDIAYDNVGKLKDRKERGVIGGSGDER